jgi:hypothetical protein
MTSEKAVPKAVTCIADVVPRRAAALASVVRICLDNPGIVSCGIPDSINFMVALSPTLKVPMVYLPVQEPSAAEILLELYKVLHDGVPSPFGAGLCEVLKKKMYRLAACPVPCATALAVPDAQDEDNPVTMAETLVRELWPLVQETVCSTFTGRWAIRHKYGGIRTDNREDESHVYMYLLPAVPMDALAEQSNPGLDRVKQVVGWDVARYSFAQRFLVFEHARFKGTMFEELASTTHKYPAIRIL